MSSLREIIDKLVDGVFEYDTDKLVFDVQSIEAKLSSKELHEGTLHITSPNGTNIKGYIYSKTMRVVVKDNEFNSNDFTVEYVFDPTGLEAGDVVKGDIQIVSSAGEYYLPYEFTILSTARDSRVSGVRNLFHFTNSGV